MKSEIGDEKTGSTQSSQNEVVTKKKWRPRKVVNISNGERIEDVSKTKGITSVTENEKKV